MSRLAVILAIDDEPGMLELLKQALKPGYAVHTASSSADGLLKVDAVQPDLILLDLRMPDMSGLLVLRKLREIGVQVPVVILTAYGSIDAAVSAVKMGAADFIQKPFETGKLLQTVAALLGERAAVEEVAKWHGIIGESPQIRRVLSLVEKYGPTDIPVVLSGETGTGKELFARAVHQIGKRRKGPFVPVDVSSIPESLVESEIFGYEKGAFTGASGSKPGRLAWAAGGTLFLDEIGNLPLACQAKLLRVIQEERYVPLGGRRERSTDFRLISATNTDLGDHIRCGAFREDLFYRISGIAIELPPLRERDGDIEILSRYYIEKYSRKYGRLAPEVSSEALQELLSYEWPGNVRELEHTLASAVVVADSTVMPHHLALRRHGEARVQAGEPQEQGEGDRKNEVVVDVSFGCDFTKPLDLKELKEKVWSETQRQVIAQARTRLRLTRSKLAEFLNIDPKTLRGILGKK